MKTVPRILLTLLGLPMAGLAAPYRVVADEPGKLVVEASLPAVSLKRSGDSGSLRVECPACIGRGPSGAPDLPGFAFSVISGGDAPRVVLSVLESETRSVPEGISPVGISPSPYRVEYRKDAAAYLRAGAPEARIGPIKLIRSVPVRGIAVPLALWSEERKELTWLKRIRIEVLFSGASPMAGESRLPGSFSAQVLNPIGGAYLQGAPRAREKRAFMGPGASGGNGNRGLAKAAASNPVLGDSLIRIRIGDRNLENLDEDRVYALRFSEALAAAPTLHAVPFRNLRLYAGPNDSLPRLAGSAIPGAGNLGEVPMDIGDANGNGIFDQGDSLLFYAHGTSLWKRLPGLSGPVQYGFVSDPYSFENGYYLDFSGQGADAPKRWDPAPHPIAIAPARTRAYHYLHAERDARSINCEFDNQGSHEDSATGFYWFWYWNGSCKKGGSPMTLTSSMLASPETALPVDAVPGDSLYLGLFPEAGDYTVWLGGDRGSMAPADAKPAPGTWYVTQGGLSDGKRFQIDSIQWGGADQRFDGYTLVYRKRLALGNSPAWIFPAAFGSRETYRVEGGEGATCLRIESGVPTLRMELDGNAEFTDSLGAEADARYLIFRRAASLAKGAVDLDLAPPASGAIRNLETGDGRDPAYLILAPRALAAQALALKKFRNQPERAFPVKTDVVFVEDIYRQYSGGRMSPPAIRDFLRWAYAEWGGRGAGANPLRYVLLFGDGHFDSRNLAMRDAPPNFIPPYEYLPSSASSGEGLASEDYYALLDSGEVARYSSGLDISLGRVPAKTAAEADAYLAKIADYEDPAKAGEWRGRNVFAADDFYQRDAVDPISQGHTNSSESLADAVESKDPGVSNDKVYLLDYRVNSAYQKPEATQDLLALINLGALMVNFVGHGASNQWADEGLLQTNSGLARMQNAGRTPIVNSFSCTVGRFEDVRSQGMSEQLVMAEGRGAIAAISSMRESFPDDNTALAKGFYRAAFPSAGAPGPVAVGDALRQAKDEAIWYISNSSRYALLGEPVLLMRKPQLGVSFTRTPDTLKALDCDSIQGRIEGGSGSGSVKVRILAGSIHKQWLPPASVSNYATQYAQERGPILFERTFPYRDHRFSTGYFIPRQIAFGDTNARITAFAWDASEEREGGTARESLSIRGQAHGLCAVDSDGQGPKIRISGCDARETGSLDFPDQVRLPLPNCLEIQVTDSVGGVLSAEGPDEGTTLEVPGLFDPFHPHPGIDELYRKVYRFPLDAAAFPVGDRLLKVSARDGYGNLSTRMLRMELTRDSSVSTVSAYNFPNPMKRKGTTFYFSTILPAQELDFQDPTQTDRLEFTIRIFNQSGNLVKVLEQAHSGGAFWDGRDAWGNLQANGIYFYRITARQILADAGAKPEYRTLSSKRNTLVISR